MRADSEFSRKDPATLMSVSTLARASVKSIAVLRYFGPGSGSGSGAQAAHQTGISGDTMSAWR
jgi:hypothetical protein